MTGLTEWIGANQTAILIGVTGLLLIVLFVFIGYLIKLNRLTKLYKRLLTGPQGDNLENTLLRILDLTESNQRRIRDAEEGIKILEENGRGMIQRVGIVRFNAFENVGSDLSFAIALLDDLGNGVVISSLYGREESRTYAKPIQRGKSPYIITQEEKEAMEKAMANG